MIIYTSVYGIAGITVLKQTAGFVIGINVITAGVTGTTGAVFDTNLVSGGVAQGPTAITIPAASGLVLGIPTPPGWYCQSGITVQPASGQVLGVMYQ